MGRKVAGQLAFSFDPPAPAPAPDLWGWTPARAAGYEPGHPWAHPDAYPDVATLIAEGVALARAAAAKPVDCCNWHLPHGFPTGRTPKAAAKRAAEVSGWQKQLGLAVDLYLQVLPLARANPEGKRDRHFLCSKNREELSGRHNHVLWFARVLEAAAIAYPATNIQLKAAA